MRDLIYIYSQFYDPNNMRLHARTARNAQLIVICAAIALTLIHQHQTENTSHAIDVDKVRYLFVRLKPEQQKRIRSLLHASMAEEFIKALEGQKSDKLLLVVASMLSALYNFSHYAHPYHKIFVSMYHNAPRTLLLTGAIAMWLITGYRRISKSFAQGQPHNAAKAFSTKAYKLVTSKEWLITGRNNYAKNQTTGGTTGGEKTSS